MNHQLFKISLKIERSLFSDPDLLFKVTRSSGFSFSDNSLNFEDILQNVYDFYIWLVNFSTIKIFVEYLGNSIYIVSLLCRF